MTSATLSPTMGHCCTCGHFGYLLFLDHMCQDCYWQERERADAANPPPDEGFELMILNHYRG